VAWRLLEREWDGWAGFALAWLSVKPHMSGVAMAAVLVWSARRGRWKVVRGFAATLACLCLGSALVVPAWPVGMLQAPRLTPLPSMTDPSYGVTWFLVLKNMGLERWRLVAAYAALAVPAAALVLRAACARTSRSADAFALGSVAAFFVSPHSLAYDFTILVFPMMVFLRGLSDRVAASLLLCVMIGFNVHYSLIQGGATGTKLGALFWLPAGLAIVGIARAYGAGHLRRGPSGARPSWRPRRSCAGESSVARGSRAGA
jgi:hypothetical protein